MDYTIEDLRGKYMKVGTPEAKVFLDACDKVGAMPISSRTTSYEFVELLSDGNGELTLYGLRNEAEAEDGSVPFTPKPQWSIYTNDKPLCELSDEQAAALFNAWRGNSEQLEGWDDTEWFELGSSHHIIKNGIYRIKQKSECELFVEKCVEVTHDGINKHLFEMMFKSGKFKLVEGNNR